MSAPPPPPGGGGLPPGKAAPDEGAGPSGSGARGNGAANNQAVEVFGLDLQSASMVLVMLVLGLFKVRRGAVAPRRAGRTRVARASA